MPLLILGIVVAAGVWWLATRADDPGSADDPAELKQLEQGAASLVGAFSQGATVSWTPPSSAGPFQDAIAAAELAHGIPAGLLLRQLDIESGHFAPDVVSGARVSSAGAIGIAQFEPGTAAQLGVNPHDAASSIAGAARYMAQLYAQFGTWTAALAAYNWGPGHVAARGTSSLPAETQTYIDKILPAAGLTRGA